MMQDINEAFDLFDKGEHQTAKEKYDQLLARFDTMTFQEKWALLLGLIYVESELKNFDLALNYANSLFGIAETDENRHIALHMTAMVHCLAKEYQIAQDYLLQERIILDTLPNADRAIAINLYEMGMTSLLSGNRSQAKDYLQDGIERMKKDGDPMTLGCLYRGLGDLHILQNEHAEARQMLQQSLQYFSLTDDSIAIQQVQDMLDDLP